MQLETVTCNNCGSSSYTVVTEGRDHEYPHTTTERFRLVRCTCGLVYLNPRPTTEELDRIYPPDYYAYQIIEQRLRAPKGQRGKMSGLRRYMHRKAVGRLGALLPLLPPLDGDRRRRILDIGCGDGTVLNQWREAVGDSETHGVEMNEKAAAIAEAQGHVVMPKRIEECDLEPSSYDLVFSSHVVEHVADPTSFMRAIHASLRPGGLVVIDTPNVDTADFRLFEKTHWGGYHFPRHWNLYDAKTFGALAKKTGFRIDQAIYMPSAVFWVWTMHSLLWDKHPKLADRLFPAVDIHLRGSPWIVGLMTFFTMLDIVNQKLLGKTSNVRFLLRKDS